MRPAPILALSLAAALMAGGAFAAPGLDLVIRNARVVDGSGRPAFTANVGVRGDTIVAVGKAKLSGRRVIDAHGRVLTPGFIDSHAHGDPLESPMRNFLSQGVTLIVLGQDGRTPGASDEDDETGGMGFRQWRDAVDRHGLNLNVAALAGFGTLREAAGAGVKTATPQQQAREAVLLQQDMDAGAFGMSSGLEYVPDRYGSVGELVALARVVGSNDGVVESHMRTENHGEISGAIDELIAQGRYARANISHIKVVSGHGAAEGDEVLAQIARARARGVRLTADVYPYTAGFADFSLVYPDWAKQESEFKDAVAHRRNELEAAIRTKVLGRNGPSAILIASGPDSGLTVEQAAKKAGKPFETYIVDAGYGGPAAAHFVMDAALQDRFVASPLIAFSTDGSPGMKHPRSWGSYSRIIEEFVVKRHALSLEQAVRKATGYPAHDILGLTDRGFVRPGMKADLVLFDPLKVHTRATWEKPAQAAEGFDVVVVNGKVAWEDGGLTDAHAGRLLRHVPRPGAAKKSGGSPK
jgi:N-acyl-D-amino-acid deacylase